jgi:hypothetical protein
MVAEEKGEEKIQHPQEKSLRIGSKQVLDRPDTPRPAAAAAQTRHPAARGGAANPAANAVGAASIPPSGPLLGLMQTKQQQQRQQQQQQQQQQQRQQQQQQQEDEDDMSATSFGSGVWSISSNTQHNN